jgi:hypothetical protein
LNTTRTAVVETLRSNGEHDRALQAACVLPRQIDLDQDAGLLCQLGVSPGELEDAAGGT